MRAGIQISSFRPLMQDEAGLRSVALHMAQMGAKVTQLQWISKAVSPQTVRAVMDEFGIAVTGVQDKSPELFADEEYYISLAAGSDICLSSISLPLDEYVAKLDKLHAKYDGTLSFHPLKDDFAQLDALIERAPYLRLVPDTCHLYITGHDVPAFIKTFAERIDTVHIKDLLNDGTVVPAGSGELPLDAVIEACRAAGVKNVLAEQEKWQGDAFAVLKQGFDAVNKRI